MSAPRNVMTEVEKAKTHPIWISQDLMRFHQTFDEIPLESLVGEIEERDEMIVELDGLTQAS